MNAVKLVTTSIIIIHPETEVKQTEVKAQIDVSTDEKMALAMKSIDVRRPPIAPPTPKNRMFGAVSWDERRSAWIDSKGMSVLQLLPNGSVRYPMDSRFKPVKLEAPASRRREVAEELNFHSEGDVKVSAIQRRLAKMTRANEGAALPARKFSRMDSPTGEKKSGSGEGPAEM